MGPPMVRTHRVHTQVVYLHMVIAHTVVAVVVTASVVGRVGNCNVCCLSSLFHWGIVIIMMGNVQVWGNQRFKGLEMSAC